RMLVRHIRSKGAMNAIISSVLKPEALKAELAKVPDMNGLELSSVVSTKEPYTVGEKDAPIRIAALDVGIKKSILKNLASRGCYVRVFPAKTPFSNMEEFEPDGYFISNGPGDPSVMTYAIKTVKDVLDADRPLFGICLGNQLLGL